MIFGLNVKEQGSCNGWSTRLPQIWLRFDSLTHRLLRVEFVVLYFALRDFTPGSPVIPSQQKPTFDLIYFDSV